MNGRRMLNYVAAMLLVFSGTALATPTASVSNCSGSPQVSGSGVSGSVSCSVTCSDGNTSGSATVSFSGGFSGTLTGTVGGACASGSGSWGGSGSFQGVAWNCSVSSSGGTLSGSCSVTLGGVAGAGSAAGAEAQVQATVGQQVSAISASVGSRMLSGTLGPSQKQASVSTGLAAGDPAKRWNAWASLSENASKYSPTDAGKKRSSTIDNAVVGADYQLSPRMVIGLSAAFDRGNGSVTAAGTGTSTEGYSIAPYLGWQLSPNMALDLSLGLGQGIAKQNGGLEAKSDREFYATNLSYGRWLGDIQISGKAGYLISKETYKDSTTFGRVNAGTAAKNQIQQFNLGVDAGYWINGVMPYIGLAYTQDVRIKTALTDTSWDRDAFILKAGVNFFSIARQMTGGVSYTEELGRRSAKNAVLMGNLNVKF